MAGARLTEYSWKDNVCTRLLQPLMLSVELSEPMNTPCACRQQRHERVGYKCCTYRVGVARAGCYHFMDWERSVVKPGPLGVLLLLEPAVWVRVL